MSLTLQTIEELEKRVEKEINNFENTVNQKGAIASMETDLVTITDLLSATKWAILNGYSNSSSQQTGRKG